MKENIEKLKIQLAEYEVARNTVCREAQEAILNPDLSDAYKDQVIDAAVETIHRIGQNRTTYNAFIESDIAKREVANAKRREQRRLKRSETIYQAK